MSNFDPRPAHDGGEMTPADQKKVAVAEITQPFFVDTGTIRAQKAAFANGDAKKLTKLPGDSTVDGFALLEGEMAFKLKNSKNQGVMTALNGLEAGICKKFPDNPRLVRDMLSLMVIPCGVVREDMNTAQNGPMITLRVGGTCPGAAPAEYNVPGQEDAFIEECCGVVYDVPDLINPIQNGTPATGRPVNKITLVPRAADKTMIATRALNVISHLIHDPVRFKEALLDSEHLANAWVNMGLRLLNSYQVAHTMALNQGLIRTEGARGAPFLVNPLFTELTGGPQVPGAPPRRIEEMVAAYAELIGILPDGRVWAGLTPAQRGYWVAHRFALKNVLLPTPHIDTKSYNAAYAFGYTRNGVSGTIESIAVNGDQPKNTPVGELYMKSLVHTQEALAAFGECVYEEQSKTMGVAHNTPNLTRTGIFNFQIIPNGGVGYLK